MTDETYEPFDPEDPFNVMAEHLRRQIHHIAIHADKFAIFRDMPLEKRLEVLICGVVTGLLTVSFCHVSPDGRDDIMTFIETYLPQARAQADGIMAASAPAKARQ